MVSTETEICLLEGVNIFTMAPKVGWLVGIFVGIDVVGDNEAKKIAIYDLFWHKYQLTCVLNLVALFILIGIFIVVMDQ